MGQIDFSSSGKYDAEKFIEGLIPLSVFLDSGLIVTRVSSAMKKAVPNLEVGSELQNIFRTIRPRSLDDLKTLDDSSFFIQIEDIQTKRSFKCAKINGSDGHFILVCNPIINPDHGPAHFNLTVSDFSTHDVMAEYVFLLKANKMGMREANEMLDEQATLLKKISASKDFYEEILNFIPIDIAVYDESHKYRFVNQTELYNKEDRESIIGKNDFEYFKERGISSEIPDKRRARFQELIDTKEPAEWKEVKEDKDGTSSTILRRLSPVYNEDEKLKMVIGYGLDITNQIVKDQKIESISRFPSENPHPVLRTNASRVVSFANNSAVKTFGLNINESNQIVPKQFAPLVNGAYTTKSSINQVITIRNKVYSTTVVKIPERDYVNIYAIDITNSKHEIEKREKKLEKEVRHRSELIKNLETVNKFSMLIQESQTKEDVVWSVCENAIKHLGYEDCIIYLLDKSKPGYLYQAAALGDKNPLNRIILGPLSIKIGEGIVGTVAETGISELVHDTSKDERYITDDINRLSEITVPIINDSQVIGIIDSEHTLKNFFPASHLNILRTISAMTATKLVQLEYNDEIISHKIRLEETVEKRTTELIEVEKLAVLGRLSAGVAHEMNTPLGAIYASTENVSELLREFFHRNIELADHDTIVYAYDLGKGFDEKTDLTSSRQERQTIKDILAYISESDTIPDAASEYVREMVECGFSMHDIKAIEDIFSYPDYLNRLNLTLCILRIRKSLGTIMYASQKTASVVKALKSYVYEGSEKSKTVFDLTDSIKNTLILFESQLKYKVQVHLNLPDNMLVEGFESETSKIWGNLIANSIYAIGTAGGNIWFDIETHPHTHTILFSNDGVPMPQEKRQNIFDPFFTTKPIGEGSGMGLSIVQNALNTLNGTIELTEDEKTTFLISIPKFDKS